MSWIQAEQVPDCRPEPKGLLVRTAAHFWPVDHLFAGEKLDPRAAIAGLELPSPPGHSPSETAWQSGLFDRGSWMEAQVGPLEGVAGAPVQFCACQGVARSAGVFQPRDAGLADHLLLPHTSRPEQAGWARTVVTGRARLGGVPVGVIAVETQVGGWAVCCCNVGWCTVGCRGAALPCAAAAMPLRCSSYRVHAALTSWHPLLAI